VEGVAPSRQSDARRAGQCLRKVSFLLLFVFTLSSGEKEWTPLIYRQFKTE